MPEGEVDAPVVDAPAATLSGPWAKDLEAAFTDPEMQRTVDAFLREKVQPHVTRMEQNVAELADAKVLMDDLINRPGETFLALTEELFGQDKAASVYDALQTGAVVEKPDGEGGTDLVVTDASALDPETKALLAELKADKDRAVYDNAIADTVTKYADTVKIVPDLFHPFVHTADGDLDKAAGAYKAFYDRFATEFGVVTPPPAALPGAPPTLGGESASGGTTPPVEKHYDSIGDALDDWFNEQRSAPPTI